MQFIIYRFNAIQVNIPANYFADINRLILKFMWKKRTQNNAEEEKS